MRMSQNGLRLGSGANVQVCVPFAAAWLGFPSSHSSVTVLQGVVGAVPFDGEVDDGEHPAGNLDS